MDSSRLWWEEEEEVGPNAKITTPTILCSLGDIGRHTLLWCTSNPNMLRPAWGVNWAHLHYNSSITNLLECMLMVPFKFIMDTCEPHIGLWWFYPNDTRLKACEDEVHGLPRGGLKQASHSRLRLCYFPEHSNWILTDFNGLWQDT